MKIQRNSLDFEKMLPEQRVIINMALRGYKYKEIFTCLGRMGIKYKGYYIRNVMAMGGLIEDILKECSYDNN